MSTAQVAALWRYHWGRQTHSASTWIMVSLIAAMAATQGIITQYMPEIITSLASPEMSQALAGTLPDPSWQQAYAGWMKNLSQIITLALIAFHAIAYANLRHNGDIPFILTKHVRRPHYLLTGAFTTWTVVVAYALIGASLTWAGTTLLFPSAPYLPIVTASLVWAVEIMFISAVQMLAATLKPGVGAPLVAGLAVFLLIAVAGVFNKIGNYSPLGLRHLSNQIATHATTTPWVITVGTAIATILITLTASIRVFNHAELT